MLRHEVVNAVAKAIGATRYLQVGSSRGLEAVEVQEVRAVRDPADIEAGAVYEVILVDTACGITEVRAAIQAACRHIHPAGVVVVSNVSPMAAWMAAWPSHDGVQLGEAWKAWVEARHALPCVSVALPSDHGTGVVFLGLPIPDATTRGPVPALDYTAMDSRRRAYLGLVDHQEFADLLARLVPVPRGTAPDMTPEPTRVEAADVELEPVQDPEPVAATPKRKRRT